MELMYEIEACVRRAALVLKDQLTVAMSDTPGGFKGINFQAGTLKEIAETLNDWSKDPVLRYEKMPIVCLLTPFLVTKSQGSELEQAKFTLFTAYPSEINQKRRERQVRSFEPILNPIVDETINQIHAAHFCHSYPTDTRFSTIEHDFWAKDKNKSIFNETVDAVETRDFTLILSSSYFDQNHF